jgi:hypothetical protein
MVDGAEIAVLEEVADQPSPLSVVSEDAPLLRMNARFRVVAASPGTSEMGAFLSVR